MKFVRTWALLALLMLPFFGGVAQADEAESRRDEAVAKLADALRVRLEARTKRAELLAETGRTKEALELLESVDTLYEKGIAEIRALFAVPAIAGGGGPAPDGGPFVEPNPDAGPPPPRLPGRKLSHLPPKLQLKAVEEAITGGLRWLAAHQAPGGSWSPSLFGNMCNGRRIDAATDGAGKDLYRVGVSALALLSFLVNDYTHEGKHPYVETVAKATAYLIKVQDPEGCIGPRQASSFVYNHAAATLALVEAFSLTRDARLRDAAQKAVAFSVGSKNPYFGWRYGVRPGDNDTSITHWMLLGLHSARATNAALVEEGKQPLYAIPESVFTDAVNWVEKMTDADYGRVGYISQGSGPARAKEAVDRFPSEYSEAMTAAGINVRFIGGQGADHPSIRKGARLLRELPPRWEPGQRGSTSRVDQYYWFLGALATSQIGGRTWSVWRSALLDHVAATPRTEGDACGLKGSWDPVGPWGHDGGRIYSTALMVQSLTVLKASLAE